MMIGNYLYEGENGASIFGPTDLRVKEPSLGEMDVGRPTMDQQSAMDECTQTLMASLTLPSPGHLFANSVCCQGLVWFNLEGHINGNEVQSVPDSFVFLQLKQ